MRKLSGLLLAATFFAIGCTKTSTPATEQTNNDYQPNTVGSYWKFKDSTTGAFSTMTSTGKMKVLDGKNYYIFNSTSPSSSTVSESYLLKANNFYDFNGLFSTGSSSGGIIFRYLNDTLKVGSSWTLNAGGITSSGYTIPAVIKGKIIERGITKKVGANTFSNVIHSRMNMQYDYTSVGLGVQEVGVYDIYVAKGIGIIKSQSKVGGFGSNYSVTSDLVEYSIK